MNLDFQNEGIGETLMGHLFGALFEAGQNSAIIRVLAPNPSRFFYERMGGQRAGERRETNWGTTLQELAYGWSDLEKSSVISVLGFTLPESSVPQDFIEHYATHWSWLWSL